MTVDPIAITFFTLTVCVLAGVILFLARTYAKTAEKLHELQKTTNEMQNQLSQQPTKLLEEAHQKAQDILGEANKQATEILEAAKSMKIIQIRN